MGIWLVNVGVVYFVIADDNLVNPEEKDPTSPLEYADHQLVKPMRGFAYYMVEHNG